MRTSREELARMSTEQLKEIIRLDSQGVEEYPTEDILYILDLLGQREEETGEVHVDVDAAWRRFQRDYLRPEEEAQVPVPIKKVRWWKRLPRGLGATAAALVLVVVGLFTAQAAGWDLLGGLPQWNDEIFTFGSLEPENPVDVKEPENIDTVSPDQQQESETIMPEVLEYDTLQEALDACGITEVKAPTWLPEGCQFQTVEQTFTSDGVFYELNTTYEYQGKSIIVGISNAAISRTQVEKVDGAVDIADIHGQTVYVIENINNFTIAWETERFECYLIGPDQEILERMADSMLN